MANFINSAEILTSQRSPSVVHFQFTAADVPTTTRRNFALPLKAGTVIQSMRRLVSEEFVASSTLDVNIIIATATVNGVASRPVAVDPLKLSVADIETLIGGTNITRDGITYTKASVATQINLNTTEDVTPPFAFEDMAGLVLSYAPADQLLVFSLVAGSAASTAGVVKLSLQVSNVKLDGIKAGLYIADQAAE